MPPRVFSTPRPNFGFEFLVVTHAWDSQQTSITDFSPSDVQRDVAQRNERFLLIILSFLGAFIRIGHRPGRALRFLQPAVQSTASVAMFFQPPATAFQSSKAIKSLHSLSLLFLTASPPLTHAFFPRPRSRSVPFSPCLQRRRRRPDPKVPKPKSPARMEAALNQRTG